MNNNNLNLLYFLYFNMYRKSTYLFIVNMANRSLNFLLRIVLRATLGVTGFGTLAVLLPIQNMILTITSYAISPSVSKFVSEDEALGKRNDLYPFLFIVVGIVLFIVGFVASSWFSSFLAPEFSKGILVPLRIMFAVIPFGVVFSIMTGIFFGKQKARIVALALLLVQMTTVIFAYILSIMFGIEGATFSFMVAYIFGISLVLLYLKKEGISWRFNMSRGLEMLRFSLPMIVTSSSIVIIFQLDILVLGIYYTPVETSIYGLVAPTARLVPAFSIALSTMLLPKLSSLKASASYEALQETFDKAFDVGFVASLPLALCIIAFSREILYVLFDSVQATQALQILCVGMFFYSMFYLFSSALQGMGKPHLPMYVLLICAIIDAGLCFALIPKYGLLGASIATSFSMMLSFLFIICIRRPSFNLNIAYVFSVLPLILFEQAVGVVGGRFGTLAVYGIVGAIYLLMYAKYTGIYKVLRDE